MDTHTCIITRRSTRKFLPRQVESDALQKVINAGRLAPSGSNVQLNHFLVITNGSVLEQVNTLVRTVLLNTPVTDDMPKGLVRAAKIAQKETFNFFYKSPVLIVVANKADNQNNIADTACALENMMLEANDLDLGSCWINQLRWLNEHPDVRAHFKTLGMDDDERIYGALALGHPNSEDGLPCRTELARTGNAVTMID